MSGTEGVDADREGDIAVAKREEKRSPKVKFNIYTPSDHKYTPYSSSTNEPDSQPVIITAPRRKKTSNE